MSDRGIGVICSIGIASLLLWISVLIWGNYLIPSFYPSVVRAMTFSVFALCMGYCGVANEEDGSLYVTWTFTWVFFVLAVWKYGAESYLLSVFYFIVSAGAFFSFWIIIIVTAASRAAKKAARKVMQFFEEIIEGIIDLFTVRSSVKTKCPRAVRAKILEAKKHSVKVGIFDYRDTMIAKETIESNEGVSPELRKGEIINLY